MTLIDVSIVAGRRPDLLRTTMASFGELVFSNFNVGRVSINIDPIFGSDEDARDCADIVRRIFPDAVVLTPERPSFCAAVKRLWQATEADFVLHLEDDWISLGRIGDEALRAFADRAVQQVSLHHADQNWDIKAKGHFHKRNNYLKLAGIKIPKFTSFPKFTTSPSFLRGDFARTCAGLLIEEFDPEKQFYSAVNPALERTVASFKNYIYSPDARPVIRDIGREWRDQRAISKTVSKGKSVWSDLGDQTSR